MTSPCVQNNNNTTNIKGTNFQPSKMSQPQPQLQTSPLLALPGEIRNQIILYTFHRPAGTTPPSSLLTSTMALAWTCRQLFFEYASVARSKSTIYPLSWTSAAHLLTQTRSLLDPVHAAEITRLMLYLPPNPESMYQRGRAFGVRGFGFKEAGLTGVREVWFRFKGEDGVRSREGVGGGIRGGPPRELIVHILWRMLWEKQLPQLSKIGFVHDGMQPLLSLASLLGMLRSFTPLVVSTRWRVQSDFEHGRLLCVEMAGAKRRVEVMVGYSFREAEEYVDVCGEIAEDKHANVIIARRRDCRFVTPLDQMTDEELRLEVDNLHTLFPVSTKAEPLLQPHVDRIRAICSLES